MIIKIKTKNDIASTQKSIDLYKKNNYEKANILLVIIILKL